MADTVLPPGIDRARHQDLSGRSLHVWWRRALLVVIAVIPLLGLLNVFGQLSDSTSTQNAAASLLVESPAQLRTGLLFSTQIVITPREQLHDARLYLDNGWFDNMSLNGISPQPSTQSSQGRWQVWDFGPLPAGSAFRVWISWQANPTNFGKHPEDAALYDGRIQLMTVHRMLTVFP